MHHVEHIQYKQPHQLHKPQKTYIDVCSISRNRFLYPLSTSFNVMFESSAHPDTASDITNPLIPALPLRNIPAFSTSGDLAPFGENNLFGVGTLEAPCLSFSLRSEDNFYAGCELELYSNSNPLTNTNNLNDDFIVNNNSTSTLISSSLILAYKGVERRALLQSSFPEVNLATHSYRIKAVSYEELPASTRAQRPFIKLIGASEESSRYVNHSVELVNLYTSSIPLADRFRRIVDYNPQTRNVFLESAFSSNISSTSNLRKRIRANSSFPRNIVLNPAFDELFDETGMRVTADNGLRVTPTSLPSFEVARRGTYIHAPGDVVVCERNVDFRIDNVSSEGAILGFHLFHFGPNTLALGEEIQVLEVQSSQGRRITLNNETERYVFRVITGVRSEHVLNFSLLLTAGPPGFIGPSFSSEAGFYDNFWVYFWNQGAERQSDFFSLPPTTREVNPNGIISGSDTGCVQIRYYISSRDGTQAYAVINGTPLLNMDHDTSFELHPPAQEGYFPLRHFNVNNAVDFSYRIRVIDLILPNRLLEDHTNIKDLMFVYVVIRNTHQNTSYTSELFLNSLVSSSVGGVMFKCTPPDTNYKCNDTAFIKFICTMSHTVAFQPFRSFSIDILNERGEVLKYQEKDSALPFTLNPELQISLALEFEKV